MEFIIFIISLLLMLLGIIFIKKLLSKNKSNEFIPSHHIDYKLIEKKEDLQNLIDYILTRDIKIIGIDTEYHKGSNYQGNLCIIQISFESEQETEVYIVDLIKINHEESKVELSKILTNENIEKVIHACERDVEWIYDEFQIIVNNIFDTQDAFKRIDKSSSKHPVGLNKLLNKYFNLNLTKQEKKLYQTSNWRKRPLTEFQLKYAALDCYYLVKLRYILSRECEDSLELEINKKNLEGKLNKKLIFATKNDRMMQRALNYFYSNFTIYNDESINCSKALFLEILKITEEYAKEYNLNSEKFFPIKAIYKIAMKIPSTKEELFNLLKEDINFNENDNLKIKFYDVIREKIQSLKEDFKINPTTYISINEREVQIKDRKNLQALRKEERKVKIKDWLSCKRPAYDNCKILAPDGELLAYCDNKKMKWYIDKNLAEMVTYDPPVFKLLFEPRTRKDSADFIISKFHILERTNCCTVCGSQDNYTRFHIIPVIYRQYFPVEYKSHNSHDIILLCMDCHGKANKVYSYQTDILSNKYNINFYSTNEELKLIHNLHKHISIAKTLFDNYSLIPNDKKLKLTEELLDFVNTNEKCEVYREYYQQVYYSNNVILPLNNLTMQILDAIRKYKVRKSYRNVKNNQKGKTILKEIKDFQNFIKDWRLFFVKSMNPKYLPEDWDVNHHFYSSRHKHLDFNKKIVEI